MKKVLFVCLGNICRSPTAEGIFRELLKREGLQNKIAHDSAGTGAWHVGEAPDLRSQECARSFGIDISDLRARQFRYTDFSEFDLILAMDRSNLRDILRYAVSEDEKAKVKLMLDYYPSSRIKDVPDPYHGGLDGFINVFQMLEVACKELLKEMKG